MQKFKDTYLHFFVLKQTIEKSFQVFLLLLHYFLIGVNVIDNKLFFFPLLGLGFSPECSYSYEIPHSNGIPGPPDVQDNDKSRLWWKRFLICFQVFTRSGEELKCVNNVIFKIFKLCIKFQSIILVVVQISNMSEHLTQQAVNIYFFQIYYELNINGRFFQLSLNVIEMANQFIIKIQNLFKTVTCIVKLLIGIK